jgi:hypothetical protein
LRFVSFTFFLERCQEAFGFTRWLLAQFKLLELYSAGILGNPLTETRRFNDFWAACQSDADEYRSPAKPCHQKAGPQRAHGRPETPCALKDAIGKAAVMLRQMEAKDSCPSRNHHRLANTKHQAHRQQHRESAYETGCRRSERQEQEPNCYHQASFALTADRTCAMSETTPHCTRRRSLSQATKPLRSSNV